MDGEFATGIIHFLQDSTLQNRVAKADFFVDRIHYRVNASYPLRHLREGEKVAIIYEASNPQQAALYNWWGYWLKLNEIIASVFIPFILLNAAKAITSRPTPEALIEDIESDKPAKRRKYN